MSKRVVAVLVEGPTDKIALRGNLNHLVKDKTLEFEPTGGDITTDDDYIANEDLNKILADDVRKLIAQRNDFTLSDIVEVIHLIDTDGLYIPDECIKQKRLAEGELITDINKHPFYNDDSIDALDVSSERRTLNNKRNAVRDLLEMKTLEFDHGIQKPYTLFYNSCNLEHALHNRRNVMPGEKRLLAKKFANEYFNDDEKFVTLFDELNLSRSWELQESWKYLKTKNS